MSIFSQRSISSGKGFIPLEIKNLRFLPTRKRVGSLTGFTLIELLVVVAVITVMTAVLLLQQQKFDSSTLLRSLAYSVALSVRQAQVYGTSVREFGSGNFNYNYGVYFSTGDPSSYYIFVDIDDDKAYDSSPTDEKVQQFKVGSKYSIVGFCGVLASGSRVCSPTLSWLSIYFKRPNPDAFFAASEGGPYSSAYIQLLGPGGDTRSVTVTSTGQILVGAFGS